MSGRLYNVTWAHLADRLCGAMLRVLAHALDPAPAHTKRVRAIGAALNAMQLPGLPKAPQPDSPEILLRSLFQLWKPEAVNPTAAKLARAQFEKVIRWRGN